MENEWGDLEAQFVTRLRDEKVEPVPAPIVALAQASLNGHPTGEKDSDGNEIRLHAMQREFETAERAAAFAKHMRNAGKHTTPPSSITVLVDPNREKVQARHAETGQLLVKADGKPDMIDGPVVNDRLVAWRAGAKRGRVAG